MKNNFKDIWKNFWGTKYWIIDNNKKVMEVLIYRKKIYIKKI